MNGLSKLFKHLIILSCCTAWIYPFVFSLIILPSFYTLHIKDAEKESEIIANHLNSMLFHEKELVFDDKFGQEVKKLVDDFNLITLKIFSSSGVVLFSTDKNEIGKKRNNTLSFENLEKKGAFSEFIKKGHKSSEGKVFYRDVISTYVPIKFSNQFVGVFEIYHDITERINNVDSFIEKKTALVFLLAFLIIAVIIFSSNKVEKIVRFYNAAEKKLHKKQTRLEKKVREKTADLESANKELLSQIEHRKNIEAALRESESNYRILVEHQTDLIVKFDMDFNLLYASPSYCETFGKSEAELLNNQFTPLIHEDDRDHVTKSLRSLANPPYTSYHEERALTKNGWRWFGWSAKAIHDENGKIDAVESVGRDITDQKKFEQELKHEKEYSDKLIDTASIIVIVLDKNGRIIKFNKAAEEITGYTKEEITGKDWFATLVPKEKYPEVWKVFESARQNKSLPKHFENPIITKSGEERLIYWQNSVVNDDVLLAFISFGNDITEQRIAENALQDSHRRLLVVLDSLNALVNVVDIETHEIIYANKFFYDQFGDYKGKKCWEIIQKNQSGPCDFCQTDKILDDEGKPAGVFTWEFKNTLNDHWYQIHEQAITWIDGRLVRLQIATDITKIKNNEEEREKLISELQEALAEIKTLQGILPICASCKKIRDDKGYWKQIESYIRDHSDAEFTHGICPECAKKLYPGLIKE